MLTEPSVATFVKQTEASKKLFLPCMVRYHLYRTRLYQADLQELTEKVSSCAYFDSEETQPHTACPVTCNMYDAFIWKPTLMKEKSHDIKISQNKAIVCSLIYSIVF